MKVYRINPLPAPLAGGYANYSVLTEKNKDHRFLGASLEEFSGRPFSKPWKKVELFFDKVNMPIGDFSFFRLSAFVCNKRARLLVGEPLEMSGELLPVSVEGQTGAFYICNVTNCLPALDPDRSTWKRAGVAGRLRVLVRPSFIPERLGEDSLFKIAEDGATYVYCVERTGDPEDGEFKAIVEHHKLTGLGFDLVWTGKNKSSDLRARNIGN